MTSSTQAYRGKHLRVVGLFSGIGGFEYGLHAAGHKTLLMCENEPGAQAVLRHHFPRIPLHTDIRELDSIPNRTDLLVGGFPCQDLSQAGRTKGINGARSSLVGEILRLARDFEVPWILLENVPFMLRLNKGEAVEYVLSGLENLGYSWAYRIVDSRSFGVPQRRQRVFILASKVRNPCDILFVDDTNEPPQPDRDSWRSAACGFYWTEGSRGLGWAHDAIPPLKPGSTVSIPSPPAIVLTSGRIVTPNICDAERLQGFQADWTLPATSMAGLSPRHRWKLVGNAVTVQVAKWIGNRLRHPGRYSGAEDEVLDPHESWPTAAWSLAGTRRVARLSKWPICTPKTSLQEFLKFEPSPLSLRAARGFYKRADNSSLSFPKHFLPVVHTYIETAEKKAAEIAAHA